MDPLLHPDLIEVSGTIQRQMDAVLAAEQEAAAITMRRRRTVRDRLLHAEDRDEQVTVTDGRSTWQGKLTAVGADHVALLVGQSEVFIYLDAATAFTFGT